jgi:DNA mismatch repair ATPase MutL
MIAWTYSSDKEKNGCTVFVGELFGNYPFRRAMKQMGE